jgi:hypothetical protein
MNTLHQLFVKNLTKDEIVSNLAIRALEAETPLIVKKDNDQNILARIARLEGFYIGGIECSLSEN